MAGLKEMGAKGELTTQRLMQAILQSGGAIEGEFARMTPTIGQALTVLGNKWSMLILDIQNNTGVFGQIAGFILDAIDWIGEAIDFVKEEVKELEPEFTAFFGSLKELWTELQPLLDNLKVIFKTIIIPVLKEFGRVALQELTLVANLLKPIADLLSTISGLIISATNGFKGLIKNAESGALQQYKTYMAEYNQTNTFNLSGGGQVQPAMQSTREFFPMK
jgi:phage-related protein